MRKYFLHLSSLIIYYITDGVKTALSKQLFVLPIMDQLNECFSSNVHFMCYLKAGTDIPSLTGTWILAAAPGSGVTDTCLSKMHLKTQQELKVKMVRTTVNMEQGCMTLPFGFHLQSTHKQMMIEKNNHKILLGQFDTKVILLIPL